ncbi:hypothetical protein REPUB_Repub04eG0257100 [Reevesia pubescens]
METNLKKSAALENVGFEEKITKSSNSGEESTHDFIQIIKGENQRHIKQEEDSSKPLSTNRKDISTIIKEDHQIESAKAKMGEVKEENERLKLLLSQIVKDYQSLQMRFLDILQQEEANKSSTNTADPSHQENEESDLVFLSLGRSSNSESKKEEKKSSYLISNDKEDDEKPNSNKGLDLGLECKFEPPGSEAEKNPSSESSLRKPEEEEPTELWPPSKILKTVRSGDVHEDASDQQMQLKKTRVSVRARCDTPTMNDGCQWRKYGQKIAKGNPCPRAYYRCTVSPTCPVRKQVQRCVEDMSILITTYEGNHNHPLPLSATAMASTTSAAASMLQSQSSSSQTGLGTSSVSAPSASTSSSAANLHGLNFNFSQNSRPYHQYYFPNSSISTTNSHPTITLDLTAAPTNSSYFNRFSNVPRYSSSTCLNFSSSHSSSLQGSNPQWNTGHLNFGTAFPIHKNSFIGPLNNILGRQPSQEHLHQSFMQMTNQAPSHQQSLSETITAATKAITSNPNFCSALAAALTSFVGAPRDNQSLPLKTAENEADRASRYVGKSSSMINPHQQEQKQESLLLFPTSKSASDPPTIRPADFNK